MRSRLPIVCSAIVAALALTQAAAAANGGFTPVEPASPNAESINESYLWVSIFTFLVLVAVEATLILFMLRYRRRGRRRDQGGPQVHGNTRLEVAWTVVPVIILALIGSFIFYKLPSIRDVPEASAAGNRENVLVKGYRFYWQFEYPNGAIAIDRLRAPVGRPVKLDVTAPDFDVIHSWWIPALGGKIDAIPGTVNETWFQAERAGVFRGQCAELCGIQHAVMTAQVEALPPDEYEAWLEERADGEGLGEEIFRGACGKCHGLSGEGDIGPRLAGNALLEDPDAIERVVREGRNAMPPVGRDWSDEQMEALTDYLAEAELGDQG